MAGDLWPIEMPPGADFPIGTPAAPSQQDFAALIKQILAGQRAPSTNIHISGGGGGGGPSNKQRTKNLAAEISDRLKQLGIVWTDKEIASLAKKAVAENWSETVITDKLLAGMDWQKVTGGDLTAGVDLIKSAGASYMLPVTTSQAQDMALRMSLGELTTDGMQSMMREQAKARFGWLAPQIDAGVKPADYFAPIRNIIADTLEMNPDSINLMDSQWMGMVEVTDPKTGGTRAATYNEAMLAARQRSEWSSTKQAQDMAANVGNQLAGLFGRAA